MLRSLVGSEMCIRDRFMFVAFHAVPKLQATAQTMQQLEESYGKTLCKNDKHLLRSQLITNQQFATFFSYGLGWGFTSVIATECKQHITPNCPESITASNVFYSVVTTIVLIFGVFCSVSHAFLGGFRLRRRADMIVTIDQGCAHQLFGDIDNDSNGYITRDELSDFLTANGLESRGPDLFIQAYDTLAGQHEEGVGITELVRQFSQLISSAKQEKERDSQQVLLEDVAIEVNSNPVRSGRSDESAMNGFDDKIRVSPRPATVTQPRQLKEQEMGATIYL
eukprot:TRINITY_DN7007_c0_g2_i9.p1 TRINITY_DN7007_c0_g2~~TRINITY_DN7007_c0_g2_i9.p1  ORF type:complete len:326 (-),score=84.77 TRINITY_DN7007_c0_g2_i9:166-1005(-)